MKDSNLVADPSVNCRVKSRSSPSCEWWGWLTDLSKGTLAISCILLVSPERERTMRRPVLALSTPPRKEVWPALATLVGDPVTRALEFVLRHHTAKRDAWALVGLGLTWRERQLKRLMPIIASRPEALRLRQLHTPRLCRHQALLIRRAHRSPYCPMCARPPRLERIIPRGRY